MQIVRFYKDLWPKKFLRLVIYKFHKDFVCVVTSPCALFVIYHLKFVLNPSNVYLWDKARSILLSFAQILRSILLNFRYIFEVCFTSIRCFYYFTYFWPNFRLIFISVMVVIFVNCLLFITWNLSWIRWTLFMLKDGNPLEIMEFLMKLYLCAYYSRARN